jgi:hypothetical protein
MTSYGARTSGRCATPLTGSSLRRLSLTRSTRTTGGWTTAAARSSLRTSSSKLTHDKRAEGAAFADPKLSDDNFGDAVLAFIASGRRTSAQSKEDYGRFYCSLIKSQFGGMKVSQVANMRAEVDAC